MLLEKGLGLNGDFYLGKGLGRGRSEGERFSGGQVTPPLHGGRLVTLYL